LRIQPQLAPAHYLRGTAHLSQGKFAEAVAELSHVIRLDQQFALAYNDRGLAYTHLGDLDAALADFQRALELDPENPLAHANRGIVQQLRGVDTEAWQDLVRGLQLSPQLVLSSWTRGWGAATREAYAQTIADYIEGRHTLEVRERDVVPAAADDTQDLFADVAETIPSKPLRVRDARATQAPRALKTGERAVRVTQAARRPETAAEPPAPVEPDPAEEVPTGAPPSDFRPDQELQCAECAKVFRWKVVTARPDGRIRCPYCAYLALPQPVGPAASAKPERPKRREPREPREPFQLHLNIPRKAWAAAAALLLAGVGYYFAFMRATAAAPVIVQTVTASDLWAQLAATPETANEKYAGRQVAVTGVIVEIRDAQAETPVVVLKATDNGKGMIECTVKTKADLKKVRAQQKVTVTGECQSHAAAEAPVQLANCRVSPAGFNYD
jgi:tetratricopeptide (TPR) repeat protein